MGCRCLALVLLVLAGAAFGADAPAPTQADLDQAVRELGSEQFKVRDQAFGRLLEWALADAGILKKLPASDPDPEIQNALESLPVKVRDRIREQRKRFYRGELVRLAGEDAKLREILQGALDCATPETIEVAQEAVSKKEDHVLTGAWAGYLAECVLDHPDPRVRQRAAYALAKLGDKSVVPQVLKFLEDADPRVRGMAAWALGQLGDQSVVPQVLKLLDDDDPRMRSMAAQALGQLGDQSVAPQVLKLLEDIDPGVRQAAAQALRTLSGETWPDDEHLIDSARAWWEKQKR